MRTSVAAIAALAAVAGAAASPAFVAPALAPAGATRLSAVRGACRARGPVALEVRAGAVPACARENCWWWW